MVNPKKVEFDKVSFISGIKDMYDLFDNITFESSDGDADGSEIDTNYYSNGKVWTSIWNTFSATGKYTVQHIKLPFHIIIKFIYLTLTIIIVLIFKMFFQHA